MNRDTIKELIAAEFAKNITTDLPNELQAMLSNWLECEIERLLQNTESIAKEDVRMKSVVIMAGKRFGKLKTLLSILQNHTLLDNFELITDLLELL